MSTKRKQEIEREGKMAAVTAEFKEFMSNLFAVQEVERKKVTENLPLCPRATH